MCHLRPLAVLAVAVCLILPALSVPIHSKIYIVRNLKTNYEADFLVGFEVGPDDSGVETLIGVFGLKPTVWDNIFRYTIPAKVAVIDSTVDKVPVAGLLEIIKYRPELYSEFLPPLLAASTPTEVAKHLPAELFQTLTQEAKAKIPPAVLAELAKLYGQ